MLKRLFFIGFCCFNLQNTIYAQGSLSFESNADQSTEIERLASRIHAHFTLYDYSSAYQEALHAIHRFPQSEILQAYYIRTLAFLGKEREMITAWDNYSKQFPAEILNRQVIEAMAWGILHKAADSSSLIMRQMSLLAALFSQDIKGIHILHRGLEDPNYAIRASAVELAGRLPDAKLSRRVQQLFKEEKNWAVRQKIISAIGSMKIHAFMPQLKAIVASNESLAEERVLAIKAILDLLDSLEREEVLHLVQSNRAGLRLLACKAIIFFQSARDLDQLFILSQDYNADVRLAALQAIGLLRPENEKQKIIDLARQAIQDRNHQVVVAAAWLLTLYSTEEGHAQFVKLLNDTHRERCISAAIGLKATGQYGIAVSWQFFKAHPDAFVRLNLALHLAGHLPENQEICQAIEKVLKEEKTKWCPIESGLFEGIATKQIFKKVDCEETPEMQDQLIRLEVLNVLAILKSVNAQEAIKQFLTEKSWGISGTAAILLLADGDELAIELVQNLLNDSHAKVRLQAALVLSLWSQEESAIRILEQSYVTGTQDQKCRILEAIARIGSIKSVPFFLQVLHEPSQTLRLIAALGIIQCLNH